MKSAQKNSPQDSTDLAWRVLGLVNLFRLLVPLVLGGLFFSLSPSPVGESHPELFIATATSYFLYAAIAIASIKRRWPEIALQATINVCVDVVAVSLFTYASGGTESGLGVLLALPVAAASFAVRQRLATLFAALGALALLTQQIFTTLALRADIGDFTATGIIGALLFVVVLSVSPLARSLRESEALVRQRDVDVANLAQLNQFIVQHLRESILVVDEHDTIRLINESAAKLLQGDSVQPGTPLGEVSPRLLYLLDIWRRNAFDPQMSTLTLVSSDQGSHVQPHFVSLSSSPRRPTLIFLEDTTLISQRVQQSKLAALGRLSASIAHEIRNPVGAMSHAAQLLAEAPTLSAQEKRLANIITSNGERVSTIINNVLQLSRRDSTRQERFELSGWLQEFLAEFRQTNQIDERTLSFTSSEEIDVRIDPSHLHQLLWNLCENALKYGRGPQGDAAIEIVIGRIAATQRPYLEVLDRGAGIEGTNADQIFEPFFTGGKGGTGLGLFIARELAQCNRAVLTYEARPGGGAVFRLVFDDPQRWE